MNQGRKQSRSQKGQILVLFAGAMVVLLLIGGLVIDGGNVFLTRRDSQNSADIGAMAGAKRLADYYVKGQAFTAADNAYTSIATRMGQNNCPSGAGSTCSWTARYVGPRTGSTFQDLGPVTAADLAPPGAVAGQKALGIKLDITKTPRTYLLGVMGQTAWTVQNTATAMTGRPNGAPAGQLLPIGLTNPGSMNVGTIYALTSGSNGPGNFGWLSWDGSNDAGSLASSICIPNSPSFVLPAEYPGDPGKTNASSVRACLQQWVDSQQPVLIPIVEAANDDPGNANACDTGGHGNGFVYCIIGIAAFVITGFAQPAVDQINGRFVGTVPYSVSGSGSPVTQPPASGSTFYYIGLAQ